MAVPRWNNGVRLLVHDLKTEGGAVIVISLVTMSGHGAPRKVPLDDDGGVKMKLRRSSYVDVQVVQYLSDPQLSAYAVPRT